MTKLPKNIAGDSNWYKDRYQSVLVQRKLLVGVTLLSLGCALVTAVSIMQLTPLKTIEPFVIQVDQRSGITQTVNPLTVQELTANEAVTNYFIVQYIRAREGYSRTDLARAYTTVRLMSEANRVFTRYRTDIDPNNPESNTARLGANIIRTVKFQSINYLAPQQVQARVLFEDRNETGAVVARGYRVITLAFEYIKLELSAEERYINPLGFRVTAYRIDEDTFSQ